MSASATQGDHNKSTVLQIARRYTCNEYSNLGIVAFTDAQGAANTAL